MYWELRNNGQQFDHWEHKRVFIILGVIIMILARILYDFFGAGALNTNLESVFIITAAILRTDMI